MSYLKTYKSPTYTSVKPRRETEDEEIQRRMGQLPNTETMALMAFGQDITPWDEMMQFTPHQGAPKKLF